MSDPKNEPIIPLESNMADRAVLTGKIASAFIPVVGSVIGELLEQLLPRQRMDRIVDFVRRLDQKVAGLELEVRQQRIKRDVDLIESALWHATRAPSEERRERIACLVANSLTREEADYLADKQLLDLLGEMNDAELIILQSYTHRVGPEAQAFRDRHERVLYVRSAHMGSPPSEVDQEVIHESYRQHLVRLGLVCARFKDVRRGELPEFDKNTGMMKRSGHEITWLGRMVLGAAGLHEDLRARLVAKERETNNPHVNSDTADEQ